MGELSLDKFKLPAVYVGYLVRLLEEGKGYARVNRINGLIEAGPTKTILPGSTVDWLMLFVYGCIEAREDRLGELEISPFGQSLVDEHNARLRGAT